MADWQDAQRNDQVDISLYEVVRKILRGWWLLIPFTLLGMGGAVGYLLTAETEYTAEMIVAPAEQEKQGGMSGLQQVGSLIGLSFGGGPSRLGRFTIMLSAVETVEVMQEKYQVLQALYQSRWQPETQTWKPIGGFVHNAKKAARAFFGREKSDEPSPEMLSEILAKGIKTEFRPDQNVMRITFTHGNPEVAAKLLMWAFTSAEDLMRQQALASAEEQIAYIAGRLEQVQNLEHRRSLLQLLQAQEQSMMMLQSGMPYGAEMVVPPRPPLDPSAPRLGVVLVLGTAGGIMAGVAAAFTWGHFRPRRPRAPRMDERAREVAEVTL